MSKDKEMSRRELRRQRMRRSQTRNRLLSIGCVTIVAVLVAFFLIYPNVKPVELINITPQVYPDVDQNSMGAADAPVLLEVWEDFQCPACRSFSNETKPRLVENYIASGKLRFTFRFYPFIDGPGGGESDQAANAAMCAADQGRFWDMHDMLFANWSGENLGAYSDRRLLAYAEALGLDMDAFRTCFREQPFDDVIQQDFQAGMEKGVNSTPSIFVDGELVTNPQGANYVPSYEQIVAAIDAALAAKGE